MKLQGGENESISEEQIVIDQLPKKGIVINTGTKVTVEI